MAARIATGATKLVSVDALYKEIGCETLEQGRNNHKLTLSYKRMNSLTPLYHTSLVPQPVSNLSRYNLRNSNDLQSINGRTKQYYHSFLPSAVRAWDNLPREAKQSASLQCFKNSLKTNTQSYVSKHYYIGSRRAQILHTRLRTNCSSLNLHLF